MAEAALSEAVGVATDENEEVLNRGRARTRSDRILKNKITNQVSEGVEEDNSHQEGQI